LAAMGEEGMSYSLGAPAVGGAGRHPAAARAVTRRRRGPSPGGGGR
jgi:hypothetical protein